MATNGKAATGRLSAFQRPSSYLELNCQALGVRPLMPGAFGYLVRIRTASKAIIAGSVRSTNDVGRFFIGIRRVVIR